MATDMNVISAWKAPGRDIDVRVTVGDKVYDKESVISCNISCDGELFKSNMKMLTLQLSGVESIESDYIDSVEIGVYAQGKYQYSYWGDFYVDYSDDSTFYDECSNTLTLIAYDGMYQLMKPLSGEFQQVVPGLLGGLIPRRYVKKSLTSNIAVNSIDVYEIFKTVTAYNGENYVLNNNLVDLGSYTSNLYPQNNIFLGYTDNDFKTYRDILDRLCEVYGVSAYYTKKKSDSGVFYYILLQPIMSNSETVINPLIPSSENSFTTNYCSSFKSKRIQKVTAVELKGTVYSITVTHPAVSNDGITLVFENDTVKPLVDRQTSKTGDITVKNYAPTEYSEELNLIIHSHQKRLLGYEAKIFDASTFGIPWCAYMPPLMYVYDSSSKKYTVLIPNVNLNVSQGMTETFSFSGFSNIKSDATYQIEAEKTLSEFEYSACESSEDENSNIKIAENDFVNCKIDINQRGNVILLNLNISANSNFTAENLLIASNIPIPVHDITAAFCLKSNSGNVKLDTEGNLYINSFSEFQSGDSFELSLTYF